MYLRMLKLQAVFKQMKVDIIELSFSYLRKISQTFLASHTIIWDVF